MLNKKPEKEIPFWFMRQAGRYLPEYRQLRSKAKNFLDFCYTPDMATEATLQPIARFGMSAAIIFSDILVIPHALGMDVWFEEGKGPQLKALQNQQELDQLNVSGIQERLQTVYQALSQTRSALPKQTSLIGFCGSAWTLACYMIEGKGSRDFQKVRLFAYENPAYFSQLIGLLEKAIIEHADLQIKAGAEVIQLFDSWAGVLSSREFKKWVIEPTQNIVKELKERHPLVPIIGFARQAGTQYGNYAQQTGVDAISIDAGVCVNWAKKELQPKVIVQGNLDNLLLATDKKAMLDQAKIILETWGDKPFIFNLGHGVIPQTPVENVQELSELIKSFRA